MYVLLILERMWRILHTAQYLATLLWDEAAGVERKW